jgi:DNA repair protein RadD
VDFRLYQKQAIEGARAALRGGKRRVLVVSPTGSGKTVIASAIIQSAVQRGSRVLFLAHRRELIHQTSAKLTAFGVRHGIIMGRERMALQHAAQVASIQTLARRRDALESVDLIFFDEAHHAAADTYLQVLAWFPSARVVGLTATPWREDGRGLADVFDSHVVVTTPRRLKEEGFLVPVGGWAFEAVDTSDAQVRGGDFVASSLAGAAMSKRVLGDVVEEYSRYGNGARGICFAATVQASEALAAQFRAAGIVAEHVDGETPKDERDAILARLRAGITRVICNCNVLTEGFDCPELEVAMLCRPTLSLTLYLQMVGRVLRTAPGKTMARIHDHAGLLAMHGHPYNDWDYEPAPDTTVNAERESSTRDATQKLCPACKSARSGWPCDNCGHSPTPAELNIEREVERRAIEDSPAFQQVQAKLAKQAGMAAHFKELSLDDKRQAFFRFVAKHGAKRAVGVYRWWSGETAWPPREWVAYAQVNGPELARFGT